MKNENKLTAIVKRLGVKHIIFIVTMAILAIVPLFVNSYVLKIFQSAAINMIFGMSLNLLMGIGGTVSFGHAAFYGVGAYTTACMWYHFGWNFTSAFPLVIVFSAIAGLLLAIPMSRITGRYVTIITLSYAEIMNLIMRNWTKVTNGVMGILNIPNIKLFGFELAFKDEQYWFILILVVVTYVMINWLVNSKLGRNLQAMRDDSIAAEAMGIPLFSHKVIIFTISAIFAGIAGALYAHIYGYIDYTVFTSNLSFNCISIVVVGGLGNFVGTIFGALFLTILPEMLRNVDFLFNYRMIVYGIILVLVMWWNHSIPGAKLKARIRGAFNGLLHRKGAETAEEV